MMTSKKNLVVLLMLLLNIKQKQIAVVISKFAEEKLKKDLYFTSEGILEYHMCEV